MIKVLRILSAIIFVPLGIIFLVLGLFGLLFLWAGEELLSDYKVI